jgi:transformer-2 protein
MSQSPEPRGERERDEDMRSRSPDLQRSKSNTPVDDKQALRRRSPPRPSHAPSNPDPTTIVGVFGLSVRTTERDLEDEFNRIAPIDKVTIVYDARVSFKKQFPLKAIKLT